VIERMIMAGFGGQGMMMIGKLLTGVAMDEGLHVTFFPSYGAEVRGGTAHCHVVMSDEPVFSPMVEEADTLIIMNQPSYDKFRPRLRAGGLLLLNTSMTEPVESLEAASPATIVPLAATHEANLLGNVRVANVLMLGAYACARETVSAESILAGVEAMLTGRKAHLLEANQRAFRKGQELAAQAVA